MGRNHLWRTPCIIPLVSVVNAECSEFRPEAYASAGLGLYIGKEDGIATTTAIDNLTMSEKATTAEKALHRDQHRRQCNEQW